MTSPERVSSPNVSLQKAYELLGVTSLHDLSHAYAQEDQKLMRAGKWDYENPALVINQIKLLLENVDPATLSEEEKEWREEILWFWYHHAISCAIWRYKDKERASEYASKALEHQPSDHPNKITRLLYLLIHEDVEGAEKLATTISMDFEKETALELIEEYKQEGFFKK